MSVVVAVRDKERGGVVLACDSLLSNDVWQDTLVDSDAKLFRQGIYVVGFVGSFRVHGILTQQDCWGNYPNPGVSLAGYLVGKIVPILRKSFRENGMMGVKEGVEFIAGYSNFVIGFLNECCKIQNDWSVVEVGDSCAIGSGFQYAEGSLYTTGKIQLDSKTRAKLAVEAAIEKNPRVGGKIHTMCTAIGLPVPRNFRKRK